MVLVYMKLPKTANQEMQTRKIRKRPFVYLISHGALKAQGAGGV